MGIFVVPSLTDLPQSLQHRLSIGSGAPLFRSIEWFQCLDEHAGFCEEPLRIFFDSEECWALPMYQSTGGPLKSMSNYYSPEFTILGSTEHLDRRELVEAAMAEAGRAGCVELRHLKRCAPGSRMLMESFGGSRFDVEVVPQTANWYRPIGHTSFDAYMNDLPTRLRNTIKRARQRLGRQHGSKFLLVDREGPALEPSILAYNEVYGKSWKPRENHPEFVPSLIRLAAAHGRVRLGILTVDGIPAAAQLWLVDGRVSHIYKLAHDARFHQFSVGSILTAEMFRQAIEVDRVEEVDFGMGDETYKREWVTHRRELLQMHVCDRRRAKGWMTLARRRLGRLARRATST